MELPSIEELAAAWAPLPRRLIERLLQLIPLPNSEAFEQFNWQVSFQRSNIFDRFDPAVTLDRTQGQSNVTTSWVLDHLSAILQKKFARSTLANWHSRGFIRYERHGYPEPEDVARLLLYYALVQAYHLKIAARDILPPTLDEQKSWCWQQLSPEASPAPSPLHCADRDSPPREASFQEARDLSLFWTPWPGAAWDRSRWVQIGGLGAISCGYLLYHSPARFEHSFLMGFLHHWLPEWNHVVPYFRDISHHGNKFQRFDLPAQILRLALCKLAESRLDGPTWQ